MQETCNNCFGSKNVARPFFRRKQLSTSAEMQQKGRATFFSTRNNCCEFLAFYGVITQSDIQSFLKTPVCGTSLSQQTQCVTTYKIFNSSAIQVRNTMGGISIPFLEAKSNDHGGQRRSIESSKFLGQSAVTQFMPKDL